MAAVGIARWDGVAWHSLGTSLSSGSLGGGATTALAVAPNGDLYVGGQFTQAGGVPVSNIAKWDGSTWSSLRVGTAAGVNRPVTALAFSPTGQLYVGGSFTQAGFTAVAGIARWDGNAWTALGSGVLDNNSFAGFVRASCGPCGSTPRASSTWAGAS